MKHLLLTTIAAVVLVGCGPQPPDISIHNAAERGNIEAVKQHLAAGADVNAKNEDSKTPLDRATGLLVLGRNAETSDLLRKHGGKHGVIIGAAAGGDIEAVKEFLAADTDVNAKGMTGWTPLHHAAVHGHKEIAELLIAAGADVNAKDDIGRTPLNEAAVHGHKETAKLLIAKDADVNAKSKEGKTPLDMAILFKHSETSDLLRKHGGKTGAELKAEGK
jgi:ankyrin repeat protein